MTWLEEIINAFENFNGEVHYSDLYEFIKKSTQRELPESWKQVIRRVIQQHSSDSQSYLNGMDIFHSTRGIGKGFWMLRNIETHKIPPAVDLGNIIDKTPPGRVKTEIFRVLRDSRLSRELKILYNNRCQVCSKVICFDEFIYSEAHHLKPLGTPHDGPDVFENMIVLCPNHHVEFDYGIIAIDPFDLTIIHKNGADESHKKLLLVKDGHPLSKEFIMYHFEKIFK